ncbi:hypothetical protein NIES4073_55190 [Kalymmatonema gypsitolerans NIES-4073]|nr:hypothetical protein NIES4073_55190 [Scytonema sp. NIES-4073]
MARLYILFLITVVVLSERYCTRNYAIFVFFLLSIKTEKTRLWQTTGFLSLVQFDKLTLTHCYNTPTHRASAMTSSF